MKACSGDILQSLLVECRSVSVALSHGCCPNYDFFHLFVVISSPPAMSRTPIPRRLLRRQLLEPSHCRTQTTSGRRGYAAESKDTKEEREDFKGQLYQSTNERVTRERAEQARFALLRETQRNARGSPAWLVPFGKD